MFSGNAEPANKFTYDAALDCEGIVHLFVNANDYRKTAIKGELSITNTDFIFKTDNCIMNFQRVPEAIRAVVDINKVHLWEIGETTLVGHTTNGPIEPVGLTNTSLAWWYGNMPINAAQMTDRPIIGALGRIFNERPRIRKAMDQFGDTVGLIDRRRVGILNGDIEWSVTHFGFVHEKNLSTSDQPLVQFDSRLRETEFETSLIHPSRSTAPANNDLSQGMLLGFEYNAATR